MSVHGSVSLQTQHLTSPEGLCIQQGGRKESAARLSFDLYLHAVTFKGPHSDKCIYMYTPTYKKFKVTFG